jgi:hypothetical protein
MHTKMVVLSFFQYVSCFLNLRLHLQQVHWEAALLQGLQNKNTFNPVHIYFYYPHKTVIFLSILNRKFPKDDE